MVHASRKHVNGHWFNFPGIFPHDLIHIRGHLLLAFLRSTTWVTKSKMNQRRQLLPHHPYSLQD